VTGSRRRFGTVRKLPSGRWQARYTPPDGIRRLAPSTFDTKRDAERWLVGTEAEMLRGDWLDPLAGRVSVQSYSSRWVAERDLKARTREEYLRHLRLHVWPYLGTESLSSVTSAHIRT
jgi:hypothetical protein